MKSNVYRYNFFPKSNMNTNHLLGGVVRTTCLMIFFLANFLSSAQETDNEIEYRGELNLSYKLNKKLKFSLTPEIRFDENFSTDKYLFEGGITYKPVKFLKLGGSYRYLINPRFEKETEYFNRYSLSAETGKKFGRFNSGFRIKYSNDADDEITDKQFLRYKLSLDYNIRKCKITPKLGVEAFHQLGNEGGMYKMRYSLGADYKLFKNNYLNFVYKLDYYYTEYLNKHIIGLGYKFKF